MRAIGIVGAALRAIREQRLRAGLSTLGVIIGTGSVLLLVGIGLGVRSDIARQVEQLGTNVAFVIPGKLAPNGQPEHMSMLGISTLTQHDTEVLGAIRGVRAAIPITFVFGSVERKGESHSAMVIAADHRMARVGANRVAEGSFYGPASPSERVCVIGHALRQELFGAGPAVGQRIEIRGVEFRVTGVLAPEEPSLFAAFSFARVVYIPWRAAMSVFPGAQINRIIVQTDYDADPDRLLGAIRKALLRTHRREDFGVLTYRQLLGAIFRVFSIVTALVAGISAISLLVAGIGIMNIMLVSVTERTREIGIRLTVGARPADIYLQFMVEAVLISLGGGFVGIALASLAAWIIRTHTVLAPVISGGALALAFGVCVLVGVVFGTAPAARAAGMTPVDALRYE